MRPGSVLVDEQIRRLMGKGQSAHLTAESKDVRPASLDLRVGERIWQVSGIPSLAGGFRLEPFIEHYTLNDYNGIADDLTLTKDNIYLAELNADLRLPSSVWGYVNPKSTAGRTDIHCIVVAEGGWEFNAVPHGYKGKLYMLAIPQSFPVRGVAGQDFTQLRLYDGPRNFLAGHEIEVLNERYGIVANKQDTSLTDDGLILHLNLRDANPIINAVSIRSGKPIPAAVRREVPPQEYFREKPLDSQGNLFLEPGEFLLAGTIEELRIPPHVCAEMVPYREQQGEFRSHYAGFFDPGFGYGRKGEMESATAVLEIRNIGNTPIILSHGQAVAMLRFEYLQHEPKHVYGEEKGKQAHYQSQKGVRFAKYFADWPQSEKVAAKEAA